MSDTLSSKEEFWLTSVSLWEDSGLSARQFCIQEGLAYQSFLSWKKRFQEIQIVLSNWKKSLPLLWF